MSDIYPVSVGNASHYSNKKLFDNHSLKKTAKLFEFNREVVHASPH